MNVRQDALEIFNAAIAAVQPAQLMRLHLSADEEGVTIANYRLTFNTFNNIYVVGAGKAAAAMAQETEKILGDCITAGLVVTKYHHALPCIKIKVTEGAHPVPDEHCVNAVKETIRLLQNVTKEDIVICLISGGASALWCDVPEGITLEEMQLTFNELIRCGAAIQEINTVRKHLSYIKGGQLIRHCNGARVFSLIISDVPGDDISVIASGPTVGNNTTFKDAHAVLTRYGLIHRLPKRIQAYVLSGVEEKINETPKPGDLIFQHTVNIIIGNNHMAKIAASKRAAESGYRVYTCDKIITAEAEKEAVKLVDFLQQYKGNGAACFIQGGETTVKVTGNGKGGRNQHFVLAALHHLSSEQNTNSKVNILVLSGGTDGTDGPTDAAGAIGDDQTLQLARQKALSVEAYLHNHDAYHFFEQTESLVVTGATQTNVMDIMLAIVY